MILSETATFFHDIEISMQSTRAYCFALWRVVLRFSILVIISSLLRPILLIFKALNRFPKYRVSGVLRSMPTDYIYIFNELITYIPVHNISIRFLYSKTFFLIIWSSTHMTELYNISYIFLKNIHLHRNVVSRDVKLLWIFWFSGFMLKNNWIFFLFHANFHKKKLYKFYIFYNHVENDWANQ